MPLKSHQASKIPDWEKEGVDPLKWNIWQKIAAKTHGIITPGNAVTLLGASLSAAGIKDITHDHKLRGVVELALGGVFDRVDGSVADKTRTKGPVGEALDATTDNIIVAYSVASLVRAGIVPRRSAYAMGGLGLVKSGIALASKSRHREVHPDWIGKFAMGFQRTAFVLHVTESMAADNDMETAATWLGRAANTSTVLSVGLGVVATARYGRDTFGPLPGVTEPVDHIDKLGEMSSVNGSAGVEPSMA